MAEVRQYMYVNTGTEIDFMEGLVDLICGLDSTITVVDADGNPTTVAEQYVDRTSATLPVFKFHFGNGMYFGIKRNNTNNNSVDKIQVGVGTSNNISYTGSFWGGSFAIDTTTTRSQYIMYVKSDNVVGLWIGAYNATSLTSVVRSILKVKTSTENYVCGATSADVMAGSFIGSNSTNTFANILPYTNESGHIDYINHSAFVSGGTKSFEFPDIYTCSTLTMGASIALPNGKNYLAIGTNALIQVDPST